MIILDIQYKFYKIKNNPNLKKGMKWQQTLIYLIIVVFILFNVLGMYMGNLIYNVAILHEGNKTINEADYLKPLTDKKKFKDLQKQDITISSVYGYKIKGLYIKNPVQTNDTIILLHDYDSNLCDSLNYAEMYLDKGFNLLLYDSRAHGKSGGKDISYGYYEQDDLENWIGWVSIKNKQEGIIGVQGDGMGAVVALEHAEKYQAKDRISFYIVNSPFSDLKQYIYKKVIQEKFLNTTFLKHVPFISNGISKIIGFYTNMVVSTKSNFKFSNVSLVSNMKNLNMPIMFIYNAQDSFLKNANETMYKEKTGVKDIYSAAATNQGNVYNNNKDEYTQKVYDFMDKAVPPKTNN